MNDCQFPTSLGIVYICMVLLGIVGIPISQSLDTAGYRMVRAIILAVLIFTLKYCLESANRR